MYYSGLVVTALPGRFDEALASLAARSDVEIHQQSRKTHRFIVVTENESVHGESDTFQALRTLAGVADVSLVVHREDH